MKVYDDEIFGPVLGVTPPRTIDEAISIVNATPYGNGVALFTSDGAAARHFQRNIHIGMVGINVAIPVPVASHSFGGWKSSPSATMPSTDPMACGSTRVPKVITSRSLTHRTSTIDLGFPRNG